MKYQNQNLKIIHLYLQTKLLIFYKSKTSSPPLGKSWKLSWVISLKISGKISFTLLWYAIFFIFRTVKLLMKYIQVWFSVYWKFTWVIYLTKTKQIMSKCSIRTVSLHSWPICMKIKTLLKMWLYCQLLKSSDTCQPFHQWRNPLRTLFFLINTILTTRFIF